MGAKHSLAPTVAEVINELPKGPCLDLCAGMCSVAGALANTGRETWCNDVQMYAALVSQCLIASVEPQITVEQASTTMLRAFKRNAAALSRRFANELQEEADALTEDSYFSYKALADDWCHAGNDTDIADEVALLQISPKFPYRLVSLIYSHGYFGLRQAIELDSLRYAIDFAGKNGILSMEQVRWCLMVLVETASKICTAPGHFAQFLEAHDPPSWKYIRRQRRRDVWTTFISSLKTISAYGTREWRAKNKVFCDDAMRLPSELRNSGGSPRIVYADPPYSEAQYSRYYHVLETLVKYDYPSVQSKGRYRNDRFSTPFSLITSVRGAFVSLIKGCTRLDADLVISYPSNGLLFQAGESLSGILHDYYRKIHIIEINHTHSTLGGRHGPMKSSVVELVFVAKDPRY